MLFIRELKKSIFSISFVIVIISMIAMAAMQGTLDFRNLKIEEPKPNGDYGMTTKETPEIIMPAALSSLYSEFTSNNYTAYPVGFYKNVKLSDEKQREMAKILSDLTGVSEEELLNQVIDNTQGDNTFNVGDNGGMTKQGEDTFVMEDKPKEKQKDIAVELKTDISYEEFKKYMVSADKLIGGGSKYSSVYLTSFGRVPVTYEEALKQYELTKNEDKFTRSYARLFCDYMGVGVLGIVPVLLAVVMCMKDKKSKMEELIYTRKTTSLRIILTRYIAMVTAVMIPTIILSYISNMQVWGMYKGMELDYLAPLKYDIGWLLPSVMISIAVGMLLTVLTDTPIAIAVQGLWWFIDINAGIAKIDGGYSLLTLAPRHNSIGNTQAHIDGLNTLITNRLLFAGLAVLLIIITVIIYEQKRKGKLNGYRKISKFVTNLANSKVKSKA